MQVVRATKVAYDSRKQKSYLVNCPLANSVELFYFREVTVCTRSTLAQFYFGCVDQTSVIAL